MRSRIFLYLIFLPLWLISPVFGQSKASEETIPDDIDSLFEESTTMNEPEEDKQEESLTVLEDLVQQTGFTFQARYAFVAGFSPGWGETPWFSDYSVADKDKTTYNNGFSKVIGVDIGSDFSLDIQLSRSFRVKQTVNLQFPGFAFDVKEFWGVYNYRDYFYLKMGKYEGSWGLGKNFGFTNLLTRIPKGASGGSAYTLQSDIPLGLGGLQLIALTRSGYVEGGNLQNITAGDMGYGAKYNIAMPWADVNLGSFYHADMAVRSYISLKTTLWGRTELYSEGLWAINQDNLDDHTFSGSIGFYDDFFDERLSLNYEYFWNGEKDISYVDDNNDLIIVEKSPFIYGHNMALNIGYKPVSGSSVTLFVSGMYNVNEETAKVMPGVRMKLMDDFSLYCSVPVALGDREGTYYRSNYDKKNRPFSVNIALRLDGDYKFAHYR